MKGWMAAAAALVAAVAALAQPAGFSAREQQQGAQVRQQILQQFGGEMTGPLADYVRGVASRVVVHTDPQVRAQDYKVTVLDSPIPNAMATPGGYLYVTRGLLSLMNDEAELASVLGHEAGHVAARHSARTQRRATLATVLGAAATILTGSDLVAMGSQLGAGLALGQFSQKQEFEADTLGLRYMTAAGYDPHATPTMLAALERQPLVEGRQATERYGAASWFSTHPVTSERVRRTEQLASQTGIAPGTRDRRREAFLNAIDGMVWGDDPAQGIISGPSFRHGIIGVGFDAPAGFQLQNSPTAVAGRAPDGSAFRFVGASLRPGQSLDDIANQAWASLLNNQVPRYERTATRVNGIETLVTRARVGTQRGSVDAGVTVYRWSNDQAFVVVTQAQAGRLQTLDPLLTSVRRLSQAEADAARRGKRVRVVTVRQGDTVQSLAQRMAFPDNQLTRFLALNGIANRPLRPGERLKIITDG